jgi:hypothetical protein
VYVPEKLSKNIEKISELPIKNVHISMRRAPMNLEPSNIDSQPSFNSRPDKFQTSEKGLRICPLCEL